MPRSTNFFKKETTDYIVENYPKNIKILDVGPGIGTYSNLLRPLGFINLDCVEVFESYVDDYKLKEKYNSVHVGDITSIDLDLKSYDLIIFGDVIEHIEQKKASFLLNSLIDVDIIVAVPFDSEQDEQFGNQYERHLQSDLSFINIFERFQGLIPLCLRFDYGVFVRNKVKKVNIETDQLPLPEDFLKLLNERFSDLKIQDINTNKRIKNKSKVTIVTALWNLGRGELSDSFKRKYDDYLKKFSDLLKTEVNMYIFIDPSDEDFIWQYRDKENTIINKMSLEDLKSWFNFTEKTNEIRKKDSWISQASWLRESPQATLDCYNPVVMSKMFMLNNVTIWNPFDSEYFFWIDAGITNTVHYGYFTHDKVFDKLPDFIENNNDFVFLAYPYEGGSEVHGFERTQMAKFCNTDYVRFVCRGGFFGGKKTRINEINGLYYGYLNSSLSEGLMGTEESIFTIIMYNHSDLITKYDIKGDGLVWPFFEDLKNKKYSDNIGFIPGVNNFKLDKISLYVIGFNSPKQFQTLIDSMLEYDPDLISRPKKYLLDNSTNTETTPEYKLICDKYGFEHIKKDNLGICGGRQWIAEHAEQNGFDGYWFSEDDMFFQKKPGEVCKNGFPRYTTNFYKKVIEIVKKENFDFLKINFTEFFGDNSTQWSWYNVPQDFREKNWPQKPKLPTMGLDPNAPKTVFKNIKSYEGIPYATGEIYYCNWTQFVTREGNKKMFLDTKFAHPFENTWMSFMYQETIKGTLNPGILLMTPIEHNRFDHYDRNIRREN